MKLYIQHAPNGGPRNFINRLRDTIIEHHTDIELVHLPFKADIRLESIEDNNPHCGVPMVVRLDGIYHDSKNTLGPTALLNAPIESAYRSAKGVIVQSYFDRGLTKEFFGDRKNIVVINNGIKLSVKENGPWQKNSKRNILVASKWRRHKRLEEMLKCFDALKKESGYEDVKMHVAGECNVSGDWKDVEFLGDLTQDQLQKYYRDAWLFLCLEYCGHCPNVLVEALSYGIPAIVGNVGGTKELISLTNNGYICEIDQSYDFRLCDLYNPPHIDYNKVILLIKNILDKKVDFKQADLSPINIKNVTKRYLDFLRNCSK